MESIFIFNISSVVNSWVALSCQKKIKNKTTKKIIIIVIIVSIILFLTGILPILRYIYLTN